MVLIARARTVMSARRSDSSLRRRLTRNLPYNPIPSRVWWSRAVVTRPHASAEGQHVCIEAYAFKPAPQADIREFRSA